MTNKELVIFQAENGEISFKSDTAHDTIYATQKQMAEVFGVDVRTINEHISNIFKTQELDEVPTVRNFRIVQMEGNRKVSRNIDHYNLDMIISVGYRVNSKTATKFRKWATSTLKQHVTKGYTINERLLKENQLNAEKIIKTIQLLSKDNIKIGVDDVLELIKSYTHTWFSLQSYDEDKLPISGIINDNPDINSDELYNAIAKLKSELMEKGEASQLFAQEKSNGNIDGILGNVMQSVFGNDVYKTLEEKASHLLYFIVKNHPFTDGNKRSAAFAFLWFLNKAKFPINNHINPNTLTTLTLLIAESDPKDKQRMISLVLQLLRGNA